MCIYIVSVCLGIYWSACLSIDLCVCPFACGDPKSTLVIFPKVSFILLFEIGSPNHGPEFDPWHPCKKLALEVHAYSSRIEKEGIERRADPWGLLANKSSPLSKFQGRERLKNQAGWFLKDDT